MLALLTEVTIRAESTSECAECSCGAGLAVLKLSISPDMELMADAVACLVAPRSVSDDRCFQVIKRTNLRGQSYCQLVA